MRLSQNSIMRERGRERARERERERARESERASELAIDKKEEQGPDVNAIYGHGRTVGRIAPPATPSHATPPTEASIGTRKLVLRSVFSMTKPGTEVLHPEEESNTQVRPFASTVWFPVFFHLRAPPTQACVQIRFVTKQQFPARFLRLSHHSSRGGV